MTNNWEWTDDWTYHDNVHIAGSGNCTSRDWSYEGNGQYYRCCVNPG